MNIPNPVIDHYDEWLAKKTKKIECIPVPGYTYPHLRWMLAEIKSGRVSGEKSHRWLGFIQGVLIREDHFSVNAERDFTRPYFNPKSEETKLD